MEERMEGKRRRERNWRREVGCGEEEEGRKKEGRVGGRVGGSEGEREDGRE